jgi:hypothetical protein
MSNKVILSALFLALFAAPLAAQEKVISQKPLDKIIDIDFPGGKIPDYLRVIEQQNGVKPNVVVSKVAAELVLPPIRLKTVTVKDAVMAIEALQWIDTYRIHIDSRNPSVLTIIAESQASGSGMSSVQVFSVKTLLEDSVRIEDIVTAIETAWIMRSQQVSAKLKYHEETKLLIAVGNRDDLRTVENVLRALTSPKPRASDLEKSIKALEVKIAKLAKDNEDLKAKLEKLSK